MPAPRRDRLVLEHLPDRSHELVPALVFHAGLATPARCCADSSAANSPGTPATVRLPHTTDTDPAGDQSERTT